MTGAADGAAKAVWYWPLFRQHTYMYVPYRRKKLTFAILSPDEFLLYCV